MFQAPPGYEARPPRDWPVPEMDHAAGGKESAYTPAMGRVILARVAWGETMKAIAADPRMPSYATIYRWLDVHEDFAEGMVQVRRERARAAIARDIEARAIRAAQRTLEEQLGLRRRRGPGRKSTYTVKAARAVCRRIVDGASLSAVARQPGMPSAKAVYRWLKNEPAFRAMYAEACRHRQWGLRFEKDLVLDQTDWLNLAAGKRRVAAIEGRMGRLWPKKYYVLP